MAELRQALGAFQLESVAGSRLEAPAVFAGIRKVGAVPVPSEIRGLVAGFFWGGPHQAKRADLLTTGLQLVGQEKARKKSGLSL